jgi:putative chitinase
MSGKENADYLMQAAMDAGITDRKELANFMGQMQVESGGFTSMEENLHYSGARLLEKFPGRNGIDNIETANRISAGGPEAVGNAIYGAPWGRSMGNTQPGDGYDYHGRGFVQLTGRNRYAEASQITGLDLVNHPELAAERTNAAAIAVDYWKHSVVPHHAQQDVERATFYINGGHNGLAARRAAAAEWEHKLEQGYVPGGPEPDRALKTGMHGHDVNRLQTDLSQLGYTDAKGRPLHPDGNFGAGTKSAVEAFQRDHGLKPDGVVGPATGQQLHTAAQSSQLNDPGISPTLTQKLDQPGAKTGDPLMDKLLASMNDPAAFKQAMNDLSNSPYGQAFHAEGRAQYAEMQNQQLQAQVAQLQAPQQAAQPQVQQAGPVMTR